MTNPLNAKDFKQGCHIGRIGSQHGPYSTLHNLAASALGVGTYRVDISINGIKVGHAVFALKWRRTTVVSNRPYVAFAGLTQQGLSNHRCP